MEGRFAWHFAENAEASQKAVNYFQQAIEKDSSFAKAYAALASVYSGAFRGWRRVHAIACPKLANSR